MNGPLLVIAGGMRPLATNTLESATRTVRHGTPSLSIVLLSTGTEDALEKALLAISDAAFEMSAEVLVIRDEAAPAADRVRRMAAQHRVELLFAPAQSDRAVMSDLAMVRARGDIVAIRPDEAVNGDEWLTRFARRLGVELGVARMVERTVERNVEQAVASRSVRRGTSAIRRIESTSEVIS